MSSKENISLYENDLPDNLNLIGDIAIDTEAMGLNTKRDRLCLVQLTDSTKRIHLIHFNSDSDYSAPNLCHYLTEARHQKIFHYGRFDIAIMKYYLGVKEIKNIFCTKIASKLVRTYTDHHGLRSLTNELLGVDIKKDQQSSDWGRDEITEAQKRYAANDVIHLHALRDKLIGMLKRENRLELAQSYFSFLNTVVDVDLLGFRDDIFSH